MGCIVIAHLGPAQETETRFLLDLAEGFRRRGHQPILWSGIYDRRFAPYYLPLNWRLKQLPEYYADLSPRAAPVVDMEKWRARVEILIKQDAPAAAHEELLNHLVAMSAQVVETFKPDLVLAWNTLCPHTGVAFDMNRAAGRHGWLIEKAVFPQTWFLEPGGLVGHSVLAGTPLEAHIAPGEAGRLAEIGRAYLERTNFGAYNRYAQAQHSEVMEQLAHGPLSERRPRIAFFPPDDGTLGFVPEEGADRRATVPHHANSFAAAKALSHAHGGITVYKVHPSLASQPHDTRGCPDLFVLDYDFRKVIEWADIVATTGSGLEFIAMAMGKPVLLLGNDILAGKGIAYEGQDPAVLRRAIAAAQAREDFAQRLERFHAYCGWLISEFLVSPADAPAPCKLPARMVDEICAQCLGGDGQHTDEAVFWAARAGLLTAKWRDKLAQEAVEEALLRDKPETPLITDAAAALEAVSTCEEDLILDFDNTLILQNSTERWLDALRPKTLAFLICLVCDFVVGFAARRRWCKAERWRDPLRVAVTTALFPWNYVWWRATAKRRMGRYLNGALAEAAGKTRARQVTIVTFGFEHVIAPLLAGAPIKATLIASGAFSPARNLRKRGKVAALLEAIGPERLKSALFVTDSRDDQEVIDHAGRSALVQWGPYPSPAFARTYFPMRYAVQGKYAGRNYFKTQILQEDLAIWLLAYAWSPLTLPILLLTFLAMYSAYEIGYWENDHVAAKNEARPTLSKTAAKFGGYPIWHGLVWMAVLSMLAIGGVSILKEHLVASWSGPSPMLAGSMWLALLVVLLVTFRLFNRLPITRRPYVFPVLHFIKNFAGAFFLPLQPLGALLLASQVGSQMMVYIAHRSGGSGAAFNRQSQRALLFGVLAGACLLTLPMETFHAFLGPTAPKAQSLLHTPVLGWCYGLQFTLILLWMAFRIVQRAYGRGIVAIMSQALHRVGRGGGREAK